MTQEHSSPKKKKTDKPVILIIDDNPTNLAVLTEYLHEHGFDILVARNSMSGLEKAHLSNPDLILLDIVLPDLNGFETCRKLKGDARTKDIPVIFITALAEDVQHKVEGFQVGGVDYITKPLQQAEVLARINTHLSIQALNRQLRQQTVELQAEIAERKRAQAELKRHRDQLEEKVQTRTVELKQLNKQLKQEITERTQTEIRLSLALNAGKLGVWDWDIATNAVVWSDNVAEIFDLKPGQFGGLYQSYLDLVYPEDLENLQEAIQHALQTGQEYYVEHRLVRPNGQIRWLEGKGQVFYDLEGRATRMTGTMQDITKRKQTEERIRASLQEKEVLLKEIHHRVKNNMQVISSLLDLQADNIQNEALLQVFKESQYRIRSMALIHERLYQSKDLSHINFADYVENLTDYLLYSYGASNISLQINVPPVFLAIDTAIPCGLIINELVSNAIKYAFPNGQAGEIWIELQTTKKQYTVLIVGDNGIGLPPEVNFQQTPSLGLTLVHMLVKQIKGEIELQSKKGTEFKLVFTNPIATRGS